MSEECIQSIPFPKGFEECSLFLERIRREIVRSSQIPMSLLEEKKKGYTASILELEAIQCQEVLSKMWESFWIWYFESLRVLTKNL